MRVLLVGQKDSIHLIKWQTEIASRGIQSKVVDLQRPPRIFIPLFFIFLYFRCLFELVRFRPHIINAHYISSYGVITSFLPHSKIILTAWGSDILLTAKKWYVKPFVKFALWRSVLIFADAKSVITEISKLSNKQLNVHLINWGVDMDLVRPSTYPNEPFVFLSLRNWEPLYNIETIIYSFEKLLTLHPYNVRLVLFGKGSLQKNIESIVQNSSFKDRIDICGYQPINKIFEFMKSSHVSITIPTSDAVSVSLLESMAAGLYIIASDLPANREWVSSDSGIFIQKNNVETLTEAMVQTIKKPIQEISNSGEINHNIIKNKANKKLQFDYIANQIKTSLKRE